MSLCRVAECRWLTLAAAWHGGEHLCRGSFGAACGSPDRGEAKRPAGPAAHGLGQGQH